MDKIVCKRHAISFYPPFYFDRSHSQYGREQFRTRLWVPFLLILVTVVITYHLPAAFKERYRNGVLQISDGETNVIYAAFTEGPPTGEFICGSRRPRSREKALRNFVKKYSRNQDKVLGWGYGVPKGGWRYSTLEDLIAYIERVCW
jgi:hypothetical protein